MIIENAKTYDVNDVEKIFFRPSFCGKSANEMGVRVLYNMPLPTKVPVFRHNNKILKEFSTGWQGGNSGGMSQRDLELSKLKAESSYSADSYFATVYEMLTNSAEVNMGDLTGTDLEVAETEIFRRSIVESVYATMWFGDVDGELSDYNAFDGFIRKIITTKENNGDVIHATIYPDTQDMNPNTILGGVWLEADEELRALAADGNLAYFVSSDIYDSYLFYLEENGLLQNGGGSTNIRQELHFHGIPLIEIPAKRYNVKRAKSFCVLTDRRNFILALNTADSPEKEARMWYNPDEMENRQRVVFLAGTTIVDNALFSAYIFDEGVNW